MYENVVMTFFENEIIRGTNGRLSDMGILNSSSMKEEKIESGIVEHVASPSFHQPYAPIIET